MAYTTKMPPEVRDEALSVVAQLPLIDKALIQFGQPLARFPPAPGPGWLGELAWAADSAVAATRLLFAGQFVGAAVIAREQLERWTLHRAHLSRIERGQAESQAAFIERTWSTPLDEDAIKDHPNLEAAEFDVSRGEKPGQPGTIRLSDGRVLAPTLLWVNLSEFIHGRKGVEAAHWEMSELLTPTDLSGATSSVTAEIVGTLAIGMRHVRQTLSAIAYAQGLERLADGLRLAFDGYSDSSGRSRRSSELKDSGVYPRLHSYMPLTPGEGLSRQARRQLRAEADAYFKVLKGQRPAGRLFNDSELATLAFSFHRERSALVALASLQLEEQEFGKESDRKSLDVRASQWVMIAEGMGLLSRWLPVGAARDAAAMAGSAIRSAYWLWLEDDDRSIAIARVALEQAARLRAWRVKPSSAEKLESRGITSPARWLEGAGMKRVGPLNRIMGDFSHPERRVHLRAAWELLSRLQLDAVEEYAIRTARRSALELTMDIVMRELIEGMSEISMVVTEGLRRDLRGAGFDIDDFGDNLERQLAHIWSEGR